MKTKTPANLAPLLALTLAFSLQSSALLQAAPLGTAFTYQGKLVDGANAANGIYDLRFAIFDAAESGTQVGLTVTNAATGVSNGLFAVTLDFGDGVFTGEARWLEIGVRANQGEEFTTLSPRQALTPSPYAMHASNAESAANLTGTLPASQLSGTVPMEQLPTAVLTNNAAGVNLSGTFTGLTGCISTSGGVGTNLCTVNTLTNHNPFMTNSWSFLHNGSLWLSPAMYGQCLNDYGGAIQWLFNGDTAPIAEDSDGSALAKIQMFYDWGGYGYAPWLMLTASNIRLEEGWLGNLWTGGTLMLGNEGYVGNVMFNYQPVEWSGSVTNGFGKPVTFYAVAIDANTNRIYCHPGIMGRAIQTANNMPAPGGQEYGQGELYFYSATPFAWGNMHTYTGHTNAIMHTNEWEFFTDVRAHGKFIGDGSGLTGIRPDAGGLTTNLVVQSGLFSTVTLCFTNGILMKIE